MKIYKLIKTYPDSPLLDSIVKVEDNDDTYVNKYWLNITWDKNLEDSIGKYVSLKLHGSVSKCMYVLVEDVIISDVLHIVSKEKVYSVLNYKIKVEDNLLDMINSLPQIGSYYTSRLDNTDIIVIPIEIRKKDYNSFTITFFTYCKDNISSSTNIRKLLEENGKFKHITYTQITSISLEDFNKSYILLQDNNIYNTITDEFD